MWTRQLTTSIAVLAAVTVIVTLRAGAGGDGGDSVGNSIRGGKMYDKYWPVSSAPEPVGDHPLYPPIGQQSGPNTFRCKECHGWDYKGADGAYGLGSSHYTGIPGVFGSTKSPVEMFDLIKFDNVPNGHGYVNYGLTDQDINDIVEFLQTRVIDTDLYIDANAQFMGDEQQGYVNYTTGGMMLNCIDCHGPNGTVINFGSPEDPEWVGTVAVHNPWELMHKIRFGQPGAMMPSWLMHGGTNQGAADIGVYAQLNFPSGTCAADCAEPRDGVVDVLDLLAVLADWGLAGGLTDINGDGTVDVLDLLEVLAAWGPCP